MTETTITVSKNHMAYIRKHGCQLLKIAWREEPKHEKIYRPIYFNILQFFLRLNLRLRPSNCVSVWTLRKSDKQKKKSYDFLDAWDFTFLAGCFAFMREILHDWRKSVRNSVQAWDSLTLNAWELTALGKDVWANTWTIDMRIPNVSKTIANKWNQQIWMTIISIWFLCLSRTYHNDEEFLFQYL